MFKVEFEQESANRVHIVAIEEYNGLKSTIVPGMVARA
jgi:hypothetical protein